MTAVGLAMWASRITIPYYSAHGTVRNPALDARLAYLLPRALVVLAAFTAAYWVINAWSGHDQSVVDRGETLLFYEKPFAARFWSTFGWALCATAVFVLIACSLLLSWVGKIVLLAFLLPFFGAAVLGIIASNDRLHVDLQRRTVRSRALFRKPAYEISFDELRMLQVEKQAPRPGTKQMYRVIVKGRELPAPLGTYPSRKEALQFISRLKSVAGAARNLPTRPGA
ncbi:MAG TPA: hypothetical protein VFQ35_18010 [Polyangiaceae bacterium]|nr:hypothetical protein [Polyangiaceae bacterium]